MVTATTTVDNLRRVVDEARDYRPPYHQGVGPDGPSSFLQNLCINFMNQIGIVIHSANIEYTVRSAHTEEAVESEVKYLLHAIIPTITLMNVIQPQGMLLDFFLFL